MIVKETEKDGKTQKKDIWKAILEYKMATQLTVSIFRVAPFWMMYLLQRFVHVSLPVTWYHMG